MWGVLINYRGGRLVCGNWASHRWPRVARQPEPRTGRAALYFPPGGRPAPLAGLLEAPTLACGGGEADLSYFVLGLPRSLHRGCSQGASGGEPQGQLRTLPNMRPIF